VDTHAGRGRHASGELGSPLVALQTLLTHAHRERLLRSSEFIFHFIERDDQNCERLESEIAGLGALPERVRAFSYSGDCFSVLERLLRGLRSSGARLEPAFVFVDPYGFKVPGRILRELMQAGRVELFVNLMWRELDMALVRARTEGSLAAVADLVFDGAEWRREISSTSPDGRADQAVNLLARKLRGRWPTFIRMLGDNDVTRYILLHLSNHDDGRDLMKECIWKVCPEGGFFVRRTDDPAQQFLIAPQADLRPLRAWILDQLRSSPLRWNQLHERVRPEIWRDAQVNEVVRQLCKEGTLSATGFKGRLSAKANPVLSIPS
jgi:three-Cys-motif partner protein